MALYKRFKLSVIWEGALLFLPNFPGATFIQGGTFIQDSREGTFISEVYVNQICVNRGANAERF